MRPHNSSFTDEALGDNMFVAYLQKSAGLEGSSIVKKKLWEVVHKLREKTRPYIRNHPSWFLQCSPRGTGTGAPEGAEVW